VIATAVAFVRRDFLIWTSYRTAFLWQVTGVLGLIGLLYLVGQAVGERLTAPVEGLSRDYFDYLLTGIAFVDVFAFGLSAFPRTIRDAQQAGTLEAMLLAHFRLFPIVFYSSVFGFLQSLVRLVIFGAMAVFAFGLWHEANPLSVLVIFLLATCVFACLGVLSAAFVLLLKQGDPVIGVYGLASAMLGGVLFPVTVLPAWLQPLSVLVPLSHALNGMRRALLGAPLTDLGFEVLSLLLMTAIFLPASAVAFNWALNRAKEEGSLVQY
jgi:ABC-2 type transport system permease protein